MIETPSVFEGHGISFVKGDILFGKLRPYLAKVLYADFSGSAVGDIYVFRPTERVDSSFGFYRSTAESFIHKVNGSTFGAKMPRASWDFIGNLKIAIPKSGEQKQIVRYIEKETARIDALISKSEKEIELLQEYRTALISEVVTGKIDVREEKI